MYRPLIFAAFALSACSQPSTAKPTPEPAPASKPVITEGAASATIIDVDGDEIGAVSLKSGPHGVHLMVNIVGSALTPGPHGMHLHAVGDCSDTGVFKLSGGHIGKIEGGHGLLNPDGPEKGDMPNLYVASDTTAGYEAFLPHLDMADVLDADGAALIIHERQDDHLSQPIGGAGGRVACAEIHDE